MLGLVSFPHPSGPQPSVHGVCRAPNLRRRFPAGQDTLPQVPGELLLGSENKGGGEPARSPKQPRRQALSRRAGTRQGTRRHRRPGRRLAGPRGDRGRVTAWACALPLGPRAGEKPRRERERHTWRGPETAGSCVSAAPVRLSQHSPPPLLPAQGHLHVPLQRGSRSPAP